MNEERRRFIRFPFMMKAELILRDKVYEADELLNLSIGGCLLPIQSEIHPNTPCTVMINLGDSESEPVVRVEGVIVRNEHGKVAVKFTAVDPENLNHLQRIARYNAPDPDRVEKEILEHPGII